MIIHVDADACPVKDEIITIALRHKIQTIMVCNGGGCALTLMSLSNSRW